MKSDTSSSNSLLSSLISLDERDRLSLLAGLSDADAEALLYDWALWARPDQLTPAGDWNVWLILAGRGWGKTRTGAEDVKTYGLSYPESRIAVVAPTYADARDTCIEGESGLLRVLPPRAVKMWNRSLGELILTNGTRYKLFSADEPERLRGPQHHRAWCDEPASWRYPDAWDQLMFGLRLGERPQAVVTGTPKPVPLIRQLLKRPDVLVTRGSTFDNAANLAPAALAQLKARYAGTRLGRQELHAEVLEDVVGALWTRDRIDATRVDRAPTLVRVVVAIDPAATSNEESDETGIVVVGLSRDGHGYVLADYSLRGTPVQWGRAAVNAYDAFHADRIIGEVNNGGEMVEHVVRTVASDLGIHVSYRAVRASRGKVTRAEPIAAVYEQGRFHHVGVFGELEDQLCSWTQGQDSPDRLDALVWGGHELFPNATGHVAIAAARSENMDPSARQLFRVAADGVPEHDEDAEASEDGDEPAQRQHHMDPDETERQEREREWQQRVARQMLTLNRLTGGNFGGFE